MDRAGLYAAIDPNDARPGVLGLVVVLALVAATALLLYSFTRQLKKVDFEEAPDDAVPPAPGGRTAGRPGPRPPAPPVARSDDPPPPDRG